MPSLPHGWVRDTAALYARVFRRAGVLALRNWAVGLVVIVYAAILWAVRLLAAPLGIVGGLLLYLTSVACFSSWLSLVEQVMRVGRVRMQDLPAGFTAYFGDLLTVGFLFWGLQLIASFVLAPFPFLQIIFMLAVFVFLNAVPELVYLGRHAPAELLMESYRFIGENWIEWFPASIVLLAGVVAVLALVPTGILADALVGIVLYFGMIVRGLLFLELATSGRRAREFRRRAAG